MSIIRTSLFFAAVCGFGVTAATVTPAEFVFSFTLTAAGWLVAVIFSGPTVLAVSGVTVVDAA